MKPSYLGKRGRDVLKVEMHQFPINGKGSWAEVGELLRDFPFTQKKKTRQVTHHKTKSNAFQQLHLSYSVPGTVWIARQKAKSCAGGVTCQFLDLDKKKKVGIGLDFIYFAEA